MKFISVRDIRTRPAEVWKDLKKNSELVVTNNGKPIALLTSLTGDDMEETLRALRKARAAEAIARMRKTASEKGAANMAPEDIDDEIRKYRTRR